MGRQLAPKRPEPKIPVDKKVVEHFVEFLEQPPAHVADRPTDYERSLKKSYISKASTSSSTAKCGRQVPQLGEQENQSVPPFNTGWSDPAVRNAARTAGLTEAALTAACIEMGLTVYQCLGLAETPTGDLAYKYVFGKPLVPPEEEGKLQTRMRHLHNWYLQVTKGRNGYWLPVNIKEEYYFRRANMHIEMSELFQLYNHDAIDVTIVSCYCL